MRKKNADLHEYNNLCVVEIHKLQREKKILVEQVNALYEQCKDNKAKKLKEEDDQQKTQILLNENDQLKIDVKMLKALVFRLNKHLERQQLRDHPNENMNSAPWGELSSNVLAPLLNSYEEKLLENIHIVDLFEKEISNITRNMKRVLDENEKLHDMNDNFQKKSELWAGERDRLNSQIDIFR